MQSIFWREIKENIVRYEIYKRLIIILKNSIIIYFLILFNKILIFFFKQ